MTGCPSLDLDPSSSTVRHPFVSSPSVPRGGTHARTLNPLLPVDALHCLLSQGYVEIFVPQSDSMVATVARDRDGQREDRTIPTSEDGYMELEVYGPQGTLSNWRLHSPRLVLNLGIFFVNYS